MELEKMNGKKRLPSIPSNYVTLLQLQERWNKEKERNQKGKEEKQQQEEKEKETNVEERVSNEVPGKGTHKNRRFPRDNGKGVAEGKPRDEKTAAEDLDNEKKGDEKKKKKKKKKWKNKKKDEMEETARAANEGDYTGNAPLPSSTGDDKGEEELIGDDIHAPKLASDKKENVEARRESRPRSVTRTHWRKAGTGRKFQAVERNKGEEELIGDEVHARKLASDKEENVEARREWKPRLNPRTHWRKAEVGRKFQATERTKGEEELVGDEVHPPELTSANEEDDEAARESESQPKFNPRTHGRTTEIGRKFEAMSVNSKIRRWDNCRYGRQNFSFNQHGGGNWEVNRPREVNQRSENMVWVKKGEIEDRKVS